MCLLACPNLLIRHIGSLPNPIQSLTYYEVLDLNIERECCINVTLIILVNLKINGRESND